MKDIILIGKQGCGKGTQGKLLAERHGYKVFETGAALRAMAAQDTELGRKVAEITGRGDLVPNEIVMEIVAEFIRGGDESAPIIFDGVPRSEEQRQTLEAELKKAGRNFIVLEITLPDEIAIQRMQGRGRSDDTPEVIAKRLENFRAHTEPLIEIWRNQGKVITVDGSKNIQEVDVEIETKLDTL